MTPLRVAAVSLLCGVCIFSLSAGQAIDQTIVPGTSGAAVVRAVIGKISQSRIFPNDNSLLRRIAYVESKDGTDGNTYRTGYHGGIWQVDQIAFQDTQDTGSHPGLVAKHEKIRQK